MSNRDIILTCSECFLGCPRLCLINVKSAKVANIRSVCIKGVDIDSAYIKGVYVKGAYIDDTCGRGVFVKSTCIDVIGAIKYSKIHL